MPLPNAVSLPIMPPFGYLKTALTFSNHVNFISVNMMYVCPCIFVYKRRKENKLGASPLFIAFINCSTYFGHLHAHHQKLETVLGVITAYGV